MNKFSRRHAVALAVAVAIGIILYVVLDLVAQLLPPHYNVLHQPESDLGVGPYAAVMNVNFVVRGLTALAAVALVMSRPLLPRQRVGAVLFETWAVCSGLLSLFRTDITDGAIVSSNSTTHGLVHLMLAFGGFSAGSIGIALLGGGAFRRLGKPWPMTLAPVVLLVVFVTAAVTTDLFGLFERLFIVSMLIWTLAVAADTMLSSRRGSAHDLSKTGGASREASEHVLGS